MSGAAPEELDPAPPLRPATSPAEGGGVLRDKLLNLWEILRTSLWPVPLAMLLLAVALRGLAFRADAAVADPEALRSWILHSGSGDDARNLLTTLVAALITMASVMFSITMVVLSLAANQFGSRLVRTYMADRRTQAALGFFVMTIVYCLLVLRSVEKDMPATAVPHLAVTLGLALALACVLVLLFFLHVVARSMVAEDVIRRVARELEGSVARLLPAPDDPVGEPPPEGLLPAGFERDAALVRSREEGYVQSIRYEELAGLAARHGVLVRLEERAGAFMCAEGWLARVHPGRALSPELEEGVRAAVLIGERRTPTQDIEFAIRHLVDIALRALSPGINDPTTALAVIDRLRGALARLMAARLPPAVHRDRDGVVRVLADGTGFGGILDAAFHQIRQAGAGQPAVVIHLLGALARLAEHARTPEQAAALRRHADLAAAAGLRQADEPRDRADIEAARAKTDRKLRHFPGAADGAGGGAADGRIGGMAPPAPPSLVAAAGHAAKKPRLAGDEGRG